MDPNKLTLEEAQLLFVENFLASRHKPKSLAPELLEKVKESLTTSARDSMTSNGIFKSEKAAYIHANVLGILLDGVRGKASTQPLTEADCVYVVSPEQRKEMEFEWEYILQRSKAKPVTTPKDSCVRIIEDRTFNPSDQIAWVFCANLLRLGFD